MSRVKTVFPTDRIAHIWMHGPQTNARNPQGNLYFEGNLLYSYRNSYPIAHKVYRPGKPVKGMSPEMMVLIQQDTYGNTTARHIGRAWQASRHVAQVAVPNLISSGLGYAQYVKDCHQLNLKWFTDRIESLTGEALRARTSTEYKLQDLGRQVLDANRYCEFFRLRKRFKIELTPETMEAMRVKARAKDKIKRDREAVLRGQRELAQAAKDAAQRPIAQAALEAWRNNINGNTGWGNRPSYDVLRLLGLNDGCALLRVVGDQVQTSQGAEFPVTHARLGLKLVRQVMASGQDWHTNGHTCHLGPFKVDRITVDGTVYAGCHVVKWSEIERIADKLEMAWQEVTV